MNYFTAVQAKRSLRVGLHLGNRSVLICDTECGLANLLREKPN